MSMNLRKNNAVRMLAVAALASCLAACQTDKDLDIYKPYDNGTFTLSLVPSIEGLDDNPSTRGWIEGNDVLKENELGRAIDVFVQGVTDATFWKQYHLSDVDLTIGVRELLANSWQAEGYRTGDKYDVYVAVNCEETHTNIASIDDLLALTFTDEKTFKRYSADIAQDIMARTTEKPFVMTSKISNWQIDPATNSQTFDLAQSDANKLKRVLAKVEITIDIKPEFFEQKTREGITFGQPSWKYANFNFKARAFEENEDLEADYALAPPLARDVRSQGGGTNDLTWFAVVDRHEIENYSYEYEDHTYTRQQSKLVTYSYPEYWGEDVAQYSPFILLRLPFTDTKQTDPALAVSYHYYRIPITRDELDRIERNHLYRITAHIASEGSSSIVEDTPIEVFYEELPWVEVATDESSVAVDRLFYYMVNPLEYELYGNGVTTGVQNLEMQYYITEGYVPTIDVNTLTVSYTGLYNESKTGLIGSGGNLTNNLLASNNYIASRTQSITLPDGSTVTARYYDYTAGSSGQAQVTQRFYYVPDTDTYYTGPSNAVERITQAYGSGNQLSAGGGHLLMVFPDEQIIRLTSIMNVNFSVKTISFSTSTEFSAIVDGVQTEETITRDIVVTHKPVDEIEAFEGAWSSRTNETYEYSYNPAADGWDPSLTYEFNTSIIIQENVTENMEVISTGTRDFRESIEGVTFRSVVPSNYNGNNRSQFNSEANGYHASDGWVYWGENPQSGSYNNNEGSPNQRDYRSGGTSYQYQNYYRIKYNANYSVVKVYYRLVANTVTWVDWDTDRTSHSTPKRVFDEHFIAKVFYNNTRIYGIEDTQDQQGNYWSGYTYTYRANAHQSTSYNRTDYTYGTNGMTYGQLTGTNGTNINLTNNKMYVIELNATSEKYVIGRPTNNNDHVVSPAFMIASQLGATPLFTGNTAATDALTHCQTYMEVGTDGTRYKGWRLPTREEIGIILGYQFVNINQGMRPVLTGDYYWTLEGAAVKTGVNEDDDGINDDEKGIYMDRSKDGTSGNVRCIRDLTEEDLARLRGN